MRYVSVILLVAVVFVPMAVAGDGRCPACDCSHFPITDPSCESCCFAQKVMVTSASSTSATVVPITRGKEQPPKTFKITRSTKVNGELKKGAIATVYYHKAGRNDVATRIDGAGYSYGSLIPANLPGPPDTCERVWQEQRRLLESMPRPIPMQMQVPLRMPSDAMRIFLGNSEAYSTGARLVVIKSGDEQLLVLQRTEAGMFVSTKVRDRQGRLAAQIVDNQFFINPHDSYHLSGAGTSSLVVQDPRGERILDVEFVNALTVKILGTFYGRNGDRISIGESEQVFESKTGAKFISEGSCFGGGPTGLIEIHSGGQITVN